MIVRAAGGAAVPGAGGFAVSGSSGLVVALDGLALRHDHPARDRNVGEVGSDLDHPALAGARGPDDPNHSPPDRQRLAAAEPEDPLELGPDRGLRAAGLLIPETALGEVEDVKGAA